MEWQKRLSKVKSILPSIENNVSVAALGIPNETVKQSLKCSLFPAYQNFLLVCDGGKFGAIKLYNLSEIERQNSASGELTIGTTPNGLLILESKPEKVFLKTNQSNHLLGTIDFFLSNYVFGESYLELAQPEDVDLWFEFLLETGLID